MKTRFVVCLCFISWMALGFASEPSREAKEIGADSEKELNAAYQQLIQRIRREQPDRADMIIDQLRKAERAWVAFRDEQAAFVSTYHEIGSAAARAAGTEAYVKELTRQRVKDLKEIPDPY